MHAKFATLLIPYLRISKGHWMVDSAPIHDSHSITRFNTLSMDLWVISGKQRDTGFKVTAPGFQDGPAK